MLLFPASALFRLPANSAQVAGSLHARERFSVVASEQSWTRGLGGLFGADLRAGPGHWREWCAGQRVCAGSSQRLVPSGSKRGALGSPSSDSGKLQREVPPPAAEKSGPWPCGPALSSPQDKRGAGSSPSLECWAARCGGDGERVLCLPVGFSALLSPPPARGTLPTALCAPRKGSRAVS